MGDGITAQQPGDLILCEEDTELDGRDNIAGRLSDEVSWLRQCADWLAHLEFRAFCAPPRIARPYQPRN